MIVYKNSTESITLEDAVKLYEMGVSVTINGKDVIFEKEEEENKVSEKNI